MKKCIPYIEVTLAMMMMGTSVAVTKVIVEKFPTFIASLLRLSFGAMFQLGLLSIIGVSLPKLKKRDVIILFIQAFLGVFLYSLFFLEGLKRTTAMESSIFNSFIPAAGSLISIIVFKEKIMWNQKAGILLATTGALLVNVMGSISDGADIPEHLFGNILNLLSAFCQAVFITFGKLTVKDIHPLAIGGIVSTIGVVLFFPFAVYDVIDFDFHSLNLYDWGGILYLGIICTGTAVTLMNHGIKRISATSVSIFTALSPVSAILICFFWFKESMSLYHIIGMIVIFAGILISVKPMQSHNSVKESRKLLRLERKP